MLDSMVRGAVWAAAWMAALVLAMAALGGASLAALAALPPDVPSEISPQVSAGPILPERAAALRDLLAQDCGACHGLTLGGGLGPSLRRDALADRPVEYLAYTIMNGRPGTPMPPWAPMLDASEGLWLAQELKGQNP